MEKLSAKEMLQILVDTAIEHGHTGMTLVLAVCDEQGIASTIHHSDTLEAVEPAHCERTLLCLTAGFYNRNLAPHMNPQTFRMGDPDEEETRQ